MRAAHTRVLGLMVLVGCSSSNTGTPTTFSTSVDGSKPVKDLTSAELTQLCEDFVTFSVAGSYQSDSCTLAGLFAAGTLAAFDTEATDAEIQTACTNAVTECQGNDTRADCMSSNNVPDTCEATVQQVVTCANDSATALRDVATMVPACGSLTRASLQSDGGGQDLNELLNPPSCAPLRAETCRTPDET